MENVTIEVARQDLEDTKADVRRLTAVVENLRSFIFNSGGEDRRSYRADLYRYESLLSSANELLPKIEAKIIELEA